MRSSPLNKNAQAPAHFHALKPILIGSTSIPMDAVPGATRLGGRSYAAPAGINCYTNSQIRQYFYVPGLGKNGTETNRRTSPQAGHLISARSIHAPNPKTDSGIAVRPLCCATGASRWPQGHFNQRDAPASAAAVSELGCIDTCSNHRTFSPANCYTRTDNS